MTYTSFRLVIHHDCAQFAIGGLIATQMAFPYHYWHDWQHALVEGDLSALITVGIIDRKIIK